MEEAVPVAHTKFRLQGRAIFLTWPQNAATKEDTLAACVQQWPSATFIVVAEEEHKTGDPHLHAVIQFEKRVDMKDCMPMLDALTGKHGNYQNVRSAKRSAEVRLQRKATSSATETFLTWRTRRSCKTESPR